MFGAKASRQWGWASVLKHTVILFTLLPSLLSCAANNSRLCFDKNVVGPWPLISPTLGYSSIYPSSVKDPKLSAPQHVSCQARSWLRTRDLTAGKPIRYPHPCRVVPFKVVEPWLFVSPKLGNSSIYWGKGRRGSAPQHVSRHARSGPRTRDLTFVSPMRYPLHQWDWTAPLVSTFMLLWTRLWCNLGHHRLDSLHDVTDWFSKRRTFSHVSCFI